MPSWLILTYCAGAEWAPDSPCGRDTFVLVDEGDFRFENANRGEVLVREGVLVPQLMQELDAHLLASGFPAAPAHDFPPGSSLVDLSRETGEELQWLRLDYFAGLKLPGYRELLRTFDAWTRCLREGGTPPGFLPPR